MWIGLTVAAVVAVAVIAAVLVAVNGSDKLRGPHRELSAPRTFDGYTLLTGQEFDAIATQMRAKMAVNSDAEKALKHALIALYSQGSSSTMSLVLIGANGNADSGAKRMFTSGEPEGNARKFLRGASATGVTKFDEGPLGGALLCGHIVAAAQELPVCLWMDYSTFGFVMSVQDASLDTLATTTLSLRNAAEH